MGTIVDFRAEWRHNNTELALLHQVRYQSYGEEDREEWEGLGNKRYAILKSDLIEVENRRVAAEQRRRAQTAQRRYPRDGTCAGPTRGKPACGTVGCGRRERRTRGTITRAAT